MITRRGQTIVEVMIAISVGVVALLALVQLSNRTVVTNGVAKRVTEAHDQATSAMELVRTEKAEAGWEAFKTNFSSGQWCFDGSAVTSGSGCGVSGSEYINDVDFVFSTSGSNEQVVVTVTMTWTEGTMTKTAVVETVMTKY
ncbi:MAG: hypothetical protein AAB909_02095 [Patescibacteria group bacterium]